MASFKQCVTRIQSPHNIQTFNHDSVPTRLLHLSELLNPTLHRFSGAKGYHAGMSGIHPDPEASDPSVFARDLLRQEPDEDEDEEEDESNDKDGDDDDGDEGYSE